MEGRGLFGKVVDSARAAPGEAGLVAMLAVLVVASAGFVFTRTSQPPAPPIQAQRSEVSPQPEELVVVHVAGMVNAPGVYELKAGSRVKDAVEAAGGAVEGADLDSLNLAALVSDGEKIYVARPGEAAPEDQSGGTGPVGKVNINSASQAQLEELPGVGPVLATRIVEHRQKKGRFTSIRQLMEVEGIGQKKYESLKDLVSV